MNTNSYESSPGRTLQAFNFALEPTAEQQAAIRRRFGVRRYACNWTVAEIRRELDLYRECGVSFGTALALPPKKALESRQAQAGSGCGRQSMVD